VSKVPPHQDDAKRAERESRAQLRLVPKSATVADLLPELASIADSIRELEACNTQLSDKTVGNVIAIAKC
jgi:hypothetical protein